MSSKFISRKGMVLIRDKYRGETKLLLILAIKCRINCNKNKMSYNKIQYVYSKK